MNRDHGVRLRHVKRRLAPPIGLETGPYTTRGALLAFALTMLGLMSLAYWMTVQLDRALAAQGWR